MYIYSTYITVERFNFTANLKILKFYITQKCPKNIVFIDNYKKWLWKYVIRWFQVFKILHIMPRLKFANLSFNNLSSDINSTINACDENEDTRETYPCLKSIVLNSTNITWRSFRHILKRIPMWVHLNSSQVKSCSVGYKL